MRLKPWQRILVTCGRCAALATFTVTHKHHDTLPPGVDIVAVARGAALPAPDHIVLRFACPQHYDAVMMQVSECCGSCEGMPLRDTWWYWARWQVAYRAQRRIGRWVRAGVA